MRPDINKKIDNILNSLDGIRQAEPQPFFYTRLMGRMQPGEKSLWENIGSFVARPVVAIAGLCFILFINVFILVQQNSGEVSVPTAGSEVIVTDNEYVLATNSSFDFENLDPQ